jgi:hypothetical protein
MFVLCPHCQFLVAVDPASGLPPAHCPRCKGALQAATEVPNVAAPTPAQTEGAAPPSPSAPNAPVERPESPDPPASPIIEPRSDPAPEPPIAAVTMPSDESTAPGEIPGNAAPEHLASEAVDSAPAASPEPPDGSVVATMHAQPDAASGLTPVRGGRHRSAVAIAGLSLVLVLQLLLADRAQLAANAQWRPLLVLLCNGLRCSLPPWHEPDAYTVLQRDVTPDPRRPGVLHVSASVRNDARWPQALPTLLLTLSDADGRVAGARAFAPAEYLGASSTKNELASGQRVAIRLDVIEPAPNIVAFTFDFR